MWNLFWERVKNIVGKEENTGYQQKILSYFTIFSVSFKVVIVWLRVKTFLENRNVNMSKYKSLSSPQFEFGLYKGICLKKVENIVGTDNAVYQQFLLLPQWFQNASPQNHVNWFIW